MNYAEFVRQRFVTNKKKIREERDNSSLNSDRNKVRARELAKKSQYFTQTRTRPPEIYTYARIRVPQQVVELLAPFHYA